MMLGFCFVRGVMLLWVMEVGFDNTYTVSGKWNVSRVTAITCTVNSHAYNHFCKYIYLFQILYSMKYYTVWVFVFCIQNWFKCENPLIFSNKKHGLQKKILYRKKSFFTVDYVKIIELHNVHTWHNVTCNLSSRWNSRCNDILKKKRSIKTKAFWKNSFLQLNFT